ncbi:MAG TPA: LuxR C-terminal-related transcriptional regulator, partial [Streptosporangiaceae bacterium]
LLKTSILDRVTADLAGELSDDQEAGGALSALAQANAFVQPLGRGWYRYHSMFADVLRVKLRRESPHRVTELHRRAARWYRRNGTLTEAVHQAAAAGDWDLAARTVVDELAMGRLLHPGAEEPLVAEFQRMPARQDLAQSPPVLIVAAANALRDRRDIGGGAFLNAAESILSRLSADDELASQLAVALLGTHLARRGGDFDTARAAVSRAEDALARLPKGLVARHPAARAGVLSNRGVMELWAGHFDDAASAFDAGMATEGSFERDDCAGHRALLEAMGGGLRRAAILAAAAAPRSDGRAERGRHVNPAAEIAVAWAEMEHNHLDEARSGLGRLAEALRANPDKLLSGVASLVEARHSLARGRAAAAAEVIARARAGWSAPSWLERRLTLAESHACAEAGNTNGALAAARRVRPESALDAAAALARAWLAAGNPEKADQALQTASESRLDAPDYIRLEACLVEAALFCRGGDSAGGRQSLELALRLGEPEGFRLPFAMERSWIEPFLRREPSLAQAFPGLLGFPPITETQPRVEPPIPDQAVPVIVEHLSDRERQVLQCVSGMLSTEEIAEELYLSVNTVKSHLRSISRKLGTNRRSDAVRRAQQLHLL